MSVINALNSNKQKTCLLLVIIASFYMAALNTTKIVEGDEVEYVDQFLNVPKVGFLQTISALSSDQNEVKEPLYGFLVYVLYYVTSGNEMLFIAIITFLIYYIDLFSIYRLYKIYQTPNYIIVSSILTLVFFSQYFFLSAQIIRQSLATSVFFLALSYKKHSKNVFLFICFISINIHISLISVISLALIPFLDDFLNKKKIILTSAATLIFSATFSLLASVLLSRIGIGGDMERVLERAASANGLVDAGKGLNQALTWLICTPLMLISLKMTLKRQIYLPPIVYNLCFIWCLFVLSLSFSPLIQYRFFFIVYNFIPLIIFLVFRQNRKISKLFSFFVCIFLILRFYWTLDEGAFEYAPVKNILLLPYPIILNIYNL